MSRLAALAVAGIAIIAVPILALVAAPSPAEARNVQRLYRGQIVLLGKRAPARFGSNAAFARFLRANRKKHIWPADKKETHWKLEFFAFFRRPVNDVEVKVKFFDVTEGKKFVAGDSLYTTQRGETILASDLTLQKPRFAINRKYGMYITDARNVLLASSVFWLRGKGEVYSGRVTFSDDEARLK